MPDSFVEISLPPGGEAGSDVAREARLPQFIGAPADATDRLDHLKVATVGAGSVGRGILLHLARLQIKRIYVVDPGRFKSTSHLTHPHILPGRELDESKCLSTAELVKQLSPKTEVYAFDGGVESLPSTALRDVDAVMLATDHLAPEVEIGQRCLYLGVPLVQASLDGPTALVQIRFFGNNSGNSACPACGYTSEEWMLLNEQTRFSCDGSYDGNHSAQSTGAPTMSTSFLCSLAADLAMVQLIKYVCSLGVSPIDTMLEYSTYNHRTTLTRLSHNEHCPCDHVQFRRAQAPQALLSECTLAELACAAGFGSGESEVSFTIGDRFVYVASALCVCGESAEINRFVADNALTTGRCACNAALPLRRFEAHRTVHSSIAQPILHRPLGQVGAAEANCVLARQGDEAVMFENSGHDGREL